MRLGNKKIFHLEAWVVKVMSIYKVRAALQSARGSICEADGSHVYTCTQTHTGAWHDSIFSTASI